jgi:O-antigen/teichoic acid export membrane protein
MLGALAERATVSHAILFRTLSTLGALHAFAIALNVARAKIISLGLGPQGLGVIGTIDQLIISLVQLSTLSLPAVAVRLLSRTYGNHEIFARKYASFLRAVLALSVGGTLLAVAVVILYPNVLSGALDRYKSEVTIALLTIPIVAMGLLLANVLAASQRPAGAAVLQFAMAGSAAASAWAGLQLGGIREIYAVSLVISGTLIVASLIYFSRSLNLPIEASWAGVVSELGENPRIVASAVVVYVSVTSAALALLVPRVVTLRSLGAEPAGLLQSVLSMVLAVGTVLGAMNTHYLGPLLNRRSPFADKMRIAASFQKRQLLLLAVGAAPLVAFPEVFLNLLFSQRFIPAATWLPPLLVWQLLLLQGNVQQQLLFSLDDLLSMVGTSLIANVAAAVLPFVLVPPYGLTGAAAAMLVGGALMNLCAAMRLRRHGYVTPRAVYALSTYVIGGLLVLPQVIGLFGGGVLIRTASCLVFVVGLWLFLDATEKRSVRSQLLKHSARFQGGLVSRNEP